MVCNCAINDYFVKTILRDKKRCQLVCCSHQVQKPFGIVCRCDALATYSVIIEALVQCSDIFCIITCEGSEQVVLMVDAILETKPVLQKECSSICSEYNAHESEVTM